MKKQGTVILYSCFRKARARQDFVGVIRQIACVRSPESIENPPVIEYAAPKTSPMWVSMNQGILNLQACCLLKKVDIQSQTEIEWAVRQRIFLSSDSRRRSDHREKDCIELRRL